MRLIKRKDYRSADPQQHTASLAGVEVFAQSPGHSWRPKPGSTTIKISTTRDSCHDGTQETPIWREVPPSELYTRNYGYLRTREKIPSPGSLYDCTGVDFFESDSPYHEVATLLDWAPAEEEKIAHGKWRSPEVFIVSISVPTEAPSGRRKTNNISLNVVMYFSIKKETKQMLDALTATRDDPRKQELMKGIDTRMINGVILWENWCRRSSNDPLFQARFKLMPKINNLAELGFPKWIKKHIRPVLIKRNGVTGFFHEHPEQSILEFHIDLHPFPNVFKRAMSYLKKNYFASIDGTLGFLIEGRSNNELPEVLIGLGNFWNVKPEIVAKDKELFCRTPSL